MSAPAHTSRATPTGDRLLDGFSTKIAFSQNAMANFWEKSVQPPGIDGGEPIPNDTMFNQVWRMKSPRKLKSMTDVQVVGAYDPKAYAALVAIVNQNGAISVRYPNYDFLDFFGWLRSVAKSPHKEGEPPEMTLVITVSNYDPVGKVEAAPVFTEYTGTGSAS